MKIDKERYNRQREGIVKWNNNSNYGTLNYIMGFGKTMVGIKLIDDFLMEEDASVCIVVPSDIIKTNWINKFKEYYNDAIIKSNWYNRGYVKILTTHEVVISNIKNSCDLLIIDEIHRFLSDNRYNIIKGNYISYNHILGLTGTYPSGIGGEMLSKYCP